jgi:hypothetical protein
MPSYPMPSHPPGEFTEEWLTSAILLISEVIVMHGPKYGPILDRLERDLEDFRSRQVNDPVARAKRHLAERNF